MSVEIISRYMKFCKTIRIDIYVLVVCTFILFMASCEEKPLPTWDEEKMIHVFTDLRIIDSQVKKHDYYDRDSVAMLYKQKLLDIYDMTEEDLNYHVELVQSDPHLAKSLEEKVIDYLTELRREASKENN